MSDCCENICVPGDQTGHQANRQSRSLWYVLVINAAMFLVTAGAALYAGSTALLSGSIDNLGDSITFGLSLYAVSRGARTKAKVSLFKGLLILCAAVAVTVQVVYKILNPAVPVFELMGLMSILGLVANFVCLVILNRHRDEDINMASVWECARNDVLENIAVLVAAGGVWLTTSQWPDTVVGLALIVLLYRSAFRILRRSRSALSTSP